MPEVPARESPLPWQEQGLQQTASGYGKRLATRYMIQVAGRWRRVYVYQFSNAGSSYIGPSLHKGRRCGVWRDDSGKLHAQLEP